jgi:hypothetical protein
MSIATIAEQLANLERGASVQSLSRAPGAGGKTHTRPSCRTRMAPQHWHR